MMSFQPQGEAKPMMGKPPAGRYVVVIKEIETKRSSGDTCDITSFRFEVTEGDYTGKSMWSRLNTNHKSSTSSNEIAQQKLSALCYALKMPQGWTNANAILDKPILLDVYVKQFDGNDKYEIGSFEQVSTAPIAPLPQSMPPQQAAAPQPQQAVNTNMNPNNGQQTPLTWQPPGR